jgi:hypothetical protein
MGAARSVLFVLAAPLLVYGCKLSASDPEVSQPKRSYAMGFSGIPPRVDVPLAIAAIDMWSRRADAAMICQEPPWDSLLAGIPPESLIVHNQLGLANYYRSKGHALWLYFDPANGLNRTGEADALVRSGRSLTEEAIQTLYRRYVVAADSILHPAHFGLALETNFIRGASSPAVYAAVRTVANDAAADLRRHGTTAKLSVSIQVEYAWGRFGGSFTGIGTDFADFPFIDELGLSSYPYLAGFTAPEQIPDDYYTGILGGRTIPVMVTEGGWTSDSLGTIMSSPALQRRYIVRHAPLLNGVHAIAVFQLTFTDLDLAAAPPPSGSALPLFAHLGLVDIALNPKPALSAWDSLYSLTLH